jgi:hypothetical protein
MSINLDPKILWVFLGLLTLIVVKTLLAWIVAWRDGKFDVREAPRFIVTQVLPYVAGLLVLALPSLWHEDLAAIYYVAAGLVAVKYIAEVKDRFMALFEVTIPNTE